MLLFRQRVLAHSLFPSLLILSYLFLGIYIPRSPTLYRGQYPTYRGLYLGSLTCISLPRPRGPVALENRFITAGDRERSAARCRGEGADVAAHALRENRSLLATAATLLSLRRSSNLALLAMTHLALLATIIPPPWTGIAGEPVHERGHRGRARVRRDRVRDEPNAKKKKKSFFIYFLFFISFS